MKETYIFAAKRTPFGKFRGKFAAKSAVELGELALKGALTELDLDPQKLDALYLGNVIQTGLKQNPARQIALNSGMREETTAMVINQVCGSSLKAVRVAEGLLNLGDVELVAVGGTESMTNAPKFQDATGELQNSLMADGLNDAFSGAAMGVTAENIAEKYQISRSAQEEFTVNSHQKAAAAVGKNWFADEIIPVIVANEEFTTDEVIRPETNLEKLATLKTIFKEDGTVTAATSSALTDGASMLILGTKEAGIKNGLKPLAKLTGYGEIGMDPNLMGYAPVYAIQKLLAQTKTTLADYDLFEINEAFAAQAIAVQQDLALPAEKLNIAGGALALGHPLGATGTRLLTTLINNLRQTHQQRGIASLCIGGGMGIAYAVEVLA